MPVRLGLAVMITCLWAASVAADNFRPINLEPIAHADAELAIMGADGAELRLSPTDLEAMDTYRLRTTTPWREQPADFDGVLLTDVLQNSGLLEVDQIRVIAENDFATVIPRALWEEVPILVATRVNDRAHSRRERGPIQFVMAMDDYRSSSLAAESHLVWMAARIEVE